MKVELSQNGIQRIVMIPETETDKAFLKDLGKAKETVLTIIDKPTPTMHGPVSEGLLIETVKKEE